MDAEPDQDSPWLEPDEQRVWYSFAYMLMLLPAALESQLQRSAGISHFDYLVLSALSATPDHTLQMSTIAHFTGSTLPRLSNVVAKLEKNGWVTRQADPDDRRCTLVSLTVAGRAKVEGAAPGHSREVRRIVFDSLTATQQRQLASIAHRILDGLGARCPDWSVRNDPRL